MPEARTVDIGLFLMTQKGLRVLEALVGRFGRDPIAYVVGDRDANVVHDYFDEIVRLCQEHRIPFYSRSQGPPSVSYAFAISWRHLIHDVPNLIVLHDSLLPRYRGFAPLPTALINGETTLGVTALFAAEEYDRGDILGQRDLEISYPIKVQTAIERVCGLYSDLVLGLFGRILAGQALVGYPQDENSASYSLWRDEADYRIGWAQDAAFIKRFIDSVGPPYRCASALLNGREVRILDAEVERDVHIEIRQPGKVIFVRSGSPVVVCGTGLLRITDLRDGTTGEKLLPLRRMRSRFV